MSSWKEKAPDQSKTTILLPHVYLRGYRSRVRTWNCNFDLVCILHQVDHRRHSNRDIFCYKQYILLTHIFSGNINFISHVFFSVAYFFPFSFPLLCGVISKTQTIFRLTGSGPWTCWAAVITSHILGYQLQRPQWGRSVPPTPFCTDHQLPLGGEHA